MCFESWNYYRLGKFVHLICIACFLYACSVDMSGIEERSGDYIDRELDYNLEDYKDVLLRNKQAEKVRAQKKFVEPEIPEISDILTAPRSTPETSSKLISLSVTEDVPVKDVLIELGRLAEVDIEVDAGITGGIIFSVKNKPFDKIIKRVSELANLRYKYDDGILRVERDLPYVENYKVDFLNIVRSNTGSISINTSVLGSSSGGSESEGLSSGSTNSITSQYDGDLWTSVENTIQNILNYTPSKLSQEFSGQLGDDTGSSSAPTMSFISNKQAGVISILATERHHKIIKRYFDDVKESASAQVLIEAKIVEVTLDDEYKTGIDWGTLVDEDSIGLKVTGNFKAGISTSSDFFTLSGVDQLTTAVSLTKKFGVSRTLSSPRLHAMNNQQAVLTFATNEVYFTIEVEEETTDAGTASEKSSLNVDSTLHTIPIGVILTLQPSINLDTKEITMNIRPTLSRITGTVNDPGVDIIVARQDTTNPISVTSPVPEIEVRELDSVLKMKSGEVMVIGGLMKEFDKNDDKGIPYISEIPVFGNLFKGVEKDLEVVETIIFIKATIVPSSGSIVDQKDREIYQKFMRDPRPIAF